MGYYTNIDDTEFFLDKKHFDQVYKNMCELNDRDDLKTGGGGSFTLPNGEALSYKDPRPEGMSYHPLKWFAWMDCNYPEKLPTMESIWEALGIETTYDDEGNLIAFYYGDKKGSEEYFFRCMAGLAREDSYIQWKGEEDTDYYRFYYKDERMYVQYGVVNITWNTGGYLNEF